MPRLLSALSLSLVFALALPFGASAQAATDRVAFGQSVHVGPGETVRDAISFGGDTVVEGTVLGDAVSFGGSVLLRRGANVAGETTAFGGPVVRDEPVQGLNGPAFYESHTMDDSGARESRSVAPAARAQRRGPLDGFLDWVAESARSAVFHVLLFLLGLLMLTLGRERLRAMQVCIVEDGLKTAGVGLLGYVASLLLCCLLALTIIGVPIALLGGAVLPLLSAVGLVAAATIIGAALPIPQLQGREIPQLAAGLGVLFLASITPVIGPLGCALAACLGFGALVRTRLGEEAPAGLTPAAA